MNSIALSEAEISSRHVGAIGSIVLNRPEALNSLNLNMVRGLNEALDRFEEDPDIAAVVIEGAGEKAFCAGGDIRMIHDSGKYGTDAAKIFWHEEYLLNARIHHFPKPYIAILNGIVMGGGVGVSVHGSIRIATEKLKLAMPETGIGFFPDIGATWLLSRAPGEIGTYLGLTGAIIGAGDAMAAGLVDVMVTSDRIAALQESLSSLSADSNQGRISKVVSGFSSEPPPGAVSANRDLIDRAFAHDDVEKILDALLADGSDFAMETAAAIRTKSPTALKVALRMLRLARTSASLEVCLNREFAGAIETLNCQDFYEGVRAAVIDKDRMPHWLPASLSDVRPEVVDRYFAPRADAPFSIA